MEGRVVGSGGNGSGARKAGGHMGAGGSESLMSWRGRDRVMVSLEVLESPSCH